MFTTCGYPNTVIHILEIYFYNLRLGSTIPVFLATPVGVSEAADDLRAILVVPLVLLEPEGVRVLLRETIISYGHEETLVALPVVDFPENL